jgi:hypothetical protein
MPAPASEAALVAHSTRVGVAYAHFFAIDHGCHGPYSVVYRVISERVGALSVRANTKRAPRAVVISTASSLGPMRPNAMPLARS